jgi:glycosyltransferase involved in cell wall biosynthesis
MDEMTEVRQRSERAPASLKAHVAFLLSDLAGGGVQRMVTILARAFAARGARVDLVVCEPEGEFRRDLPAEVDVVPLRRCDPLRARLAVCRADLTGARLLARPMLSPKQGSTTLSYLPSLATYLRTARPDVLFAATSFLNIEAVLARRLARVPTRIVLSERNHFSSGKPRKDWRRRYLGPAMRHAYLQADAIIAVSEGVADDIAQTLGIARSAITTLHNPTLTPDFAIRTAEVVEHPWFAQGGPPVILSVGRLAYQKDFPTLVRAFARVRRRRPARLVIGGKGNAKQVGRIYELARELDIEDSVQVLGFLRNPLPYMARAAVFALSSRFEGFPNVLLEALACGTPVVSTDCPSGPREILDGGAYGPLVEVGDDAALAEAIVRTLDDPPAADRLKARAAIFDYETAIARYQAVLLGDPPLHKQLDVAADSSRGRRSGIPAAPAVPPIGGTPLAADQGLNGRNPTNTSRE